MQFQKRVLLLALAAGLAGCGEDGELFGSTKQEGKLTIALTDAPVESAAKVVVTFNEIELLRADNERLTFGLRETGGGCEATDEAVAPNDACALDLLTLANGNSVVLLNEDLKQGDYTQIRLGVLTGNQTYIELDDGSQFPLLIPSQVGLRLVRSFSIDKDEPVSFTIDFDVRKSLVHLPNGNYKLRPTLRIVDTAEAAEIVGTVDEDSLVNRRCDGDYINGFAGVLYVFPGHDVTPDDIDLVQNTVEPIATTTIAYNPSTSVFSFRAAFLPPGDYSVAYTCDGDDPEANETLSFTSPVEVTLEEGDRETLVLE